jgi:hypothetical protein
MRAVEGVSPYNYALALYGYACYIFVRGCGASALRKGYAGRREETGVNDICSRKF